MNYKAFDEDKLPKAIREVHARINTLLTAAPLTPDQRESLEHLRDYSDLTV